ncbi:hypothetical protein [Alkaliphilus metalliredigens]|nr:hypothetical protein [Alkaliphilus metalliredigens]
MGKEQLDPLIDNFLAFYISIVKGYTPDKSLAKMGIYKAHNSPSKKVKMN